MRPFEQTNLFLTRRWQGSSRYRVRRKDERIWQAATRELEEVQGGESNIAALTRLCKAALLVPSCQVYSSLSSPSHRPVTCHSFCIEAEGQLGLVSRRHRSGPCPPVCDSEVR